ncbi:phage replisome organizer N-terminal domain-containing protein [Clostridium sp. LP20]|uniref:phage replisome organizer N-terminal domain-containing protein n=1 Tax=Clostridium sp. LP20 TaxID=3418665 RepID=UPI003EE613C2
MSDNKKYYYLKIKENFYETEDMKILQAMDNGYLYSDILMKLYLKSLKTDGKLMFKENIPYSPKMIATITNHNTDTVDKALCIFRELGLIEVLDNGAIYMLDIQSLIGKSSSEADRKREYRNRIKEERHRLLGEGDICPDIVPIDSDKHPPENRDRDRDRVRDKDNNIKLSLSLYEELGFGSINTVILSDLELLEEEYTEVWVQEALKEANAAGVRNIKYVKGILKNWKTKGFKLEKPQRQNNSKTNGFNNFEPRSIYSDENQMADLEKKLLGWEE